MPWGKDRAPVFEVGVIYIRFHRGVKAISRKKVYICQQEAVVVIEGLAFLGVDSADTAISYRS